MNKKKVLIGIAAVALLALMVSSASACNPGLTPGFWKNNLAVYLNTPPGARAVYSDPGPNDCTAPIGGLTKDTMGDYFAWLQTYLPMTFNGVTYQSYAELYAALSYIGGGATGAAIRNNAANFFNNYAGLGLL